MNFLTQIGQGLAACTGILMVFAAFVSIGLGLQYFFNVAYKATSAKFNIVKAWLVKRKLKL